MHYVYTSVEGYCMIFLEEICLLELLQGPPHVEFNLIGPKHIQQGVHSIPKG